MGEVLFRSKKSNQYWSIQRTPKAAKHAARKRVHRQHFILDLNSLLSKTYSDNDEQTMKVLTFELSQHLRMETHAPLGISDSSQIQCVQDCRFQTCSSSRTREFIEMDGLEEGCPFPGI